MTTQWFHTTYEGVAKRDDSLMLYYDNLISYWAWIVLLWNNLSLI